MAVSNAIVTRIAHFIKNQYFAIMATVRAVKIRARKTIASISPSEVEELLSVSVALECRDGLITKNGPLPSFTERESPFVTIVGSGSMEAGSESVFFCGILEIM